MANASGKQFATGFRSAVIFALGADGLPAATGTSAYEGFEVIGPKAYTLEVPTIRKITFMGSDRALALDFLPATEASSAELQTAADDIPLNAFLSGVTSYNVGEATMMNLQTDQQGNEPDVAMVMFQQSLDTASHLRNYRFHILPKTRAIPAGQGMDENAVTTKYSLAPNPSTTHIWGSTMTTGSEGSLEAGFVNGMSKGRPKVVAFLGNNSNLIFRLPTSKPATSIAKISVWVNGALQTGGGGDYTATTTTITFDAAPASGAKVVVFYEY